MTGLLPSIAMFVVLCGLMFAAIELALGHPERRRKRAAADEASQTEADAPAPELAEDEVQEPVQTLPEVTETDPQISEAINGYFALALKSHPTATDKLMLECGIYVPTAQRNLTIARLVLVVVFGVAVALLGLLSSPLMMVLASLGVIGAAYGLPILVLRRRAAMVRHGFAGTFPDFLDIFVICMETGMTPEAAMAQIARLMVQTERQFGIQLLVAVYEVRAGRTAYEALGNFAARTRLDVAKDLAALIQESVQLGLSVGKAVRVYAKEMRQTAILNAEERANALPVKMVIPLTVFLLPANMLVILSPTIINLVTSLKAFFGNISQH